MHDLKKCAKFAENITWKTLLEAATHHYYNAANRNMF